MDGWRLAWYVGVIWSLGTFICHGREAWEAFSGAPAAAILSAWLWRWQHTALALAAAALLATLMMRVPRWMLGGVAAGAAVTALSEALPLSMYRPLWWSGPTDVLTDLIIHPLWLLTKVGGVLIVLWAILRPSAVTPRRLALLAAILLLAAVVSHASLVAQLLLKAVSIPTTLMQLLFSPHWLLTYLRHVAQLAAAIIIWYSLRASPPSANRLHLAGWIGLVVPLGSNLAQHVLGYWPSDDVLLTIIGNVGVTLMLSAPLAALIFWPRHPVAARPVSPS